MGKALKDAPKETEKMRKEYKIYIKMKFLKEKLFHRGILENLIGKKKVSSFGLWLSRILHNKKKGMTPSLFFTFFFLFNFW